MDGCWVVIFCIFCIHQSRKGSFCVSGGVGAQDEPPESHSVMTHGLAARPGAGAYDVLPVLCANPLPEKIQKSSNQQKTTGYILQPSKKS